MYLDAGLCEGDAARDQAGHRLRGADCLHHVHRRLHHLLLHRRVGQLHPGHDHLRHDQEAGHPGGKRHLHPAVPVSAGAAGAVQPEGGAAGGPGAAGSGPEALHPGEGPAEAGRAPLPVGPPGGGGGAGVRLPGVGGLSQLRHRLPACSKCVLLGGVYRHRPHRPV